ncbi:Atc1p SKDI_04G4070 [Saccharomyces kudriavzevii IFO 1802]|uniref:Uncharacterized protein n=2 Tax=Saccharomyces kudriavzevii (strain ATCC MYA-4449 / AS 2.2408 / CBS 8840 / NBRC 1802 / NCYC 2889) TaxID=226230 RepID=A0AA35JG45_SACK1|nr:uncharacterized protein SKDI_04G4070 [Saccharomyces kudriavzevii IFO 1802]EJT44868.1 ATC1-like protein [Saccharomyces kudriavzevii IFO 1802]CAI4058435.1 hypothetical protein SKDI_04G4070 [Saccharomyces kudriavzevii IFO 1802]
MNTNQSNLNADLSDDINIEHTLHRLLTQANDHFDDTVKIDGQSLDLEKDLEQVMMDNLGCTDIFDSDIVSQKHLTLDSLFHDEHNTDSDTLLEMQKSANDSLVGIDLDRHDCGDDSTSKASSHNNTNQNTVHKTDREGKTYKIDKPAIKKKKIPLKITNETMLSPASLSPSSSLASSDTNESHLKIESMITDITSKIDSARQDIVSATKPAKLTNEFTMNQISEMKARIINTHKLLLNFNFIKEGYARSCIQLKKTMDSLKDSEIHRAHLLVENDDLKQQILELTQTLNEKKSEKI